ncbi:PH domain-containing protein [Streptomyces sp. NPDC054766]
MGPYGAFRIPVKLYWRVTADRTGLWLNGLRGTTHIPWDDVRSVRRESVELKLRWRGGGAWTVAAPRWAWFQRRRGVTHPYDALAAEVTAMHTDPALRPTGDSEERERGRPLWPPALPFVLVWLTAVLAGLMGFLDG